MSDSAGSPGGARARSLRDLYDQAVELPGRGARAFRRRSRVRRKSSLRAAPPPARRRRPERRVAPRRRSLGANRGGGPRTGAGAHRPVPDSLGARAWRDGPRLSRRAGGRRFRASGGAQGRGPGRQWRRRDRAPFPRRAPDPRAPRASRDRPPLRRRPRRGRALVSRARVRRGFESHRPRARARPGDCRAPAPLPRRPRGGGVCARRLGRPSRPQAGQHPGRPRRQTATARFRDRQVSGRRRGGNGPGRLGHPHRYARAHAGLCESGAVSRCCRHSRLGRLLAGSGVLRAPGGRASLPTEGNRSGDRARHPRRGPGTSEHGPTARPDGDRPRSRTAPVRPASGEEAAAGPRRHLSQGAAEEPGRPLRFGGRVRRGRCALPRRSPRRRARRRARLPALPFLSPPPAGRRGGRRPRVARDGPRLQRSCAPPGGPRCPRSPTLPCACRTDAAQVSLLRRRRERRSGARAPFRRRTRQRRNRRPPRDRAGEGRPAGRGGAHRRPLAPDPRPRRRSTDRLCRGDAGGERQPSRSERWCCSPPHSSARSLPGGATWCRRPGRRAAGCSRPWAGARRRGRTWKLHAPASRPPATRRLWRASSTTSRSKSCSAATSSPGNASWSRRSPPAGPSVRAAAASSSATSPVSRCSAAAPTSPNRAIAKRCRSFAKRRVAGSPGR